MLMGWNSMRKGWWCGVIGKLIKWISCHMTRQRFSAHLTYIGTPWKVIARWNQNRTIAYLFMLLSISIYIPSQIFPSSLYISPFTLQLACLHSFIWGLFFLLRGMLSGSKSFSLIIWSNDFGPGFIPLNLEKQAQNQQIVHNEHHNHHRCLFMMKRYSTQLISSQLITSN